MPDPLPWNAKLIARAMARGVDRTIYHRTREGVKVIEPGTPLALKQASHVLGCRVLRMERASQTQEFREMLEGEMKAVRLLEQAANLATAIGIRDDPATDPSLRLDAIQAIRQPIEPVEARLPGRSVFSGRLRIRRKLLRPI